MTPAYSNLDLFLLTAASLVAIGAIAAVGLAKSSRLRSLASASAIGRLSEPTLAVIGVSCGVAVYLLVAPVFGWAGVRGPMGIIAFLAFIAVVGSVAMDLKDNADEHDGDES